MTDPNIKKIASILKENSDSVYAHVRYQDLGGLGA